MILETGNDGKPLNFKKNKGEIHMNMEAVFGHFPLLESEKLVLNKIEEKHVQDVFSIYDNRKVFDYCGIIPKHNIKIVHKMIGAIGQYWSGKGVVDLGIYGILDHSILL